MFSRLRRLALSTLLALLPISGAALALPALALAATCNQAFLIGPYITYNESDHRDFVQSSAQINCSSFGRGGIKVEFEIIKVSTGGVVGNPPIVGPCGAGCDFHHINVVARTAVCSSTLATTYYARWRYLYDDKFPWSGWMNGPNKSLNCRV